MKTGYIISLETEADYDEVENLTREAFWNVYCPGCLEHFVLHCFRTRDDFIAELDFVLEKEGRIIGHVMYAHSEIKADDGHSIPIMTFGPISIAPDFQRQGYGTILLQYSMDKAKKLGAGALAIAGNINFYGKCGFVVAKTKGVRYSDDPDADYFLIKELEDGFLNDIKGTYKDPSGYFVDEKDAEQFDSHFPPKQRLKLPGQLL